LRITAQTFVTNLFYGEESTSQANNSSPGRNILGFVWNPELHYRARKSTAIVPGLKHITSAHTDTFCFFEILLTPMQRSFRIFYSQPTSQTLVPNILLRTHLPDICSGYSPQNPLPDRYPRYSAQFLLSRHLFRIFPSEPISQALVPDILLTTHFQTRILDILLSFYFPGTCSGYFPQNPLPDTCPGYSAQFLLPRNLLRIFSPEPTSQAPVPDILHTVQFSDTYSGYSAQFSLSRHVQYSSNFFLNINHE
jgi:hypothetical protein